MSRPIKEYDHVRIKAFGIEGYVVETYEDYPEGVTVEVNVVDNPLSEEAKAKADILNGANWALFDCDRSELELIEPDEEEIRKRADKARKQEELRSFLSQYLGRWRGKAKRKIVTQESIDRLVGFAWFDDTEQDIIDYGTTHPEAPFCDFVRFIKPVLEGDLIEEELLEDD